MARILLKNTFMPTKSKQVFSTAEDNQSAVTIHVLEGENKLAADNISIGQFKLEGIDPAPKGEPQIEVTISIDSDYIFSVTALDQKTGNEIQVSMDTDSGLTDEEIEEMTSLGIDLSYEDACGTYSKTKLKVGAIISVKLDGGYRRYGILGGKNRIISVCPTTDLVSILDHKGFLSGTEFSNGSFVHRMGYRGEEKRTLRECYEWALSLLGSKYSDSESFVMACRFSNNSDFSLEEIDDGMQFLSDL